MSLHDLYLFYRIMYSYESFGSIFSCSSCKIFIKKKNYWFLSNIKNCMLQTSLTIKIAFTFFLLWNQMTFTVGVIYFSNGHGQTPPWRKIYVLNTKKLYDWISYNYFLLLVIQIYVKYKFLHQLSFFFFF